MFAIFRFTSETWESLPENYKNSPFLTLDPDLVCTEANNKVIISEGIADTIEEPEPMAVDERSDQDVNDDSAESTDTQCTKSSDNYIVCWKNEKM